MIWYSAVMENSEVAARRKLAFLESRALSSMEQSASSASASAYAEAFGLDMTRLLEEIRSEFTPASALAQIDSEDANVPPAAKTK